MIFKKKIKNTGDGIRIYAYPLTKKYKMYICYSCGEENNKDNLYDVALIIKYEKKSVRYHIAICDKCAADDEEAILLVNTLLEFEKL